MRLVGFHGLPRSGKDTCSDWLCETEGFKKISFSQPLDEMLRILNPHMGGGMRLNDFQHSYEVMKDRAPEFRRLLKAMGLAGRTVLGEDVWLNYAASQMRPDGSYVLCNVRYRNEFEWVLNNGGVVVKVTSPLQEQPTDWQCDTDLMNVAFPPQFTVENDGSVEDLHVRMRRFVDEVL